MLFINIAVAKGGFVFERDSFRYFFRLSDELDCAHSPLKNCNRPPTAFELEAMPLLLLLVLLLLLLQLMLLFVLDALLLAATGVDAVDSVAAADAAVASPALSAAAPWPFGVGGESMQLLPTLLLVHDDVTAAVELDAAVAAAVVGGGGGGGGVVAESAPLTVVVAVDVAAADAIEFVPKCKLATPGLLALAMLILPFILPFFIIPCSSVIFAHFVSLIIDRRSLVAFHPDPATLSMPMSMCSINLRSFA